MHLSCAKHDWSVFSGDPLLMMSHFLIFSFTRSDFQGKIVIACRYPYGQNLKNISPKDPFGQYVWKNAITSAYIIAKSMWKNNFTFEGDFLNHLFVFANGEAMFKLPTNIRQTERPETLSIGHKLGMLLYFYKFGSQTVNRTTLNLVSMRNSLVNYINLLLFPPQEDEKASTLFIHDPPLELCERQEKTSFFFVRTDRPRESKKRSFFLICQP